jgi:hypothetical protein
MIIEKGVFLAMAGFRFGGFSGLRTVFEDENDWGAMLFRMGSVWRKRQEDSASRQHRAPAATRGSRCPNVIPPTREAPNSLQQSVRFAQLVETR